MRERGGGGRGSGAGERTCRARERISSATEYLRKGVQVVWHTVRLSNGREKGGWKAMGRGPDGVRKGAVSNKECTRCGTR